MTVVTATITTKCNFRCKHCLRSLKGKDLNVKIFEKFVQGTKELGANHVAITGGEPIMHKDFREILQIVKDNNIQYSIVTNGAAIKQYIELHKEISGLTNISLSLESYDKKTNDAIREKNSFDYIVKAAKVCKENQIPFSISTTIGKLNFFDLEKTILFAREIGAHCIVLSTILPYNEDTKIALSTIEREALYFKIQHLIKKYKEFPIYPGTPIGSTGINQNLCAVMDLNYITLDCDGYINFCCNLANVEQKEEKRTKIASLEKKSFKEAIEEYKKEIKELLKNRPEDFNSFEGDEINYNSCFYCLKRFFNIEN
jgi:MoaA/NifB/PqqE/SkfB family radical SAM enzyme